MSDRELLTECLDVLTHDAAQRTFAGGVRMSQLAIKLRDALAAPRPEPVFDGQSGHPVMLPRAPEPVLGLISDEVRAALKAADAVESQEAYRTRTPAAAPSEDIETLRRDAFRKGFYAGFAATGEGWNGEYPFQDMNRPIVGNPSVEAAIDEAMQEDKT